MCMHIIAGQCLSTSIDYCSRAFLFFPSFTLSPSPLSSFPFPLIFLPSSSFSLPFLPPFLFFTLPFPTPPFHPISPFSPISSSLIPPPFSLRSLLSLGASFPSNPLFLSYSSINPTPSFFYPFILSYPSIPSYRSFPSYPFFPSYPSIPSYHSFHSYPFFPSYTLLFLPIHLSLPPLLFFISLIYLFATFPSSAPFHFSHFFTSFPFSHRSFPSYPSILSYPISIHSYPLFLLLASLHSLPSVICYLYFYSYPSFTSTFPPTSPSFPFSLTFPSSYHSLRLPFTALLCSPPLSFTLQALSLSLSPY